MAKARAHDEPEVYGCKACGVLNEAATARVAQLTEEVALRDREIGAARTALRRERATQAHRLAEHPHFQEAMEVLELWRSLCSPRSHELNGPRLKAVLERFEHSWPADSLKKAVIGYSRFPYVVDGRRVAAGPRERRYVDAEMIFRDAKMVEKGIALCDRTDEEVLDLPVHLLATIPWRRVFNANRSVILKALSADFGAPVEVDDGFLLWPCPRCGPENPEMAALRLAPPDWPWIARCSHCGLSDVEILAAITDPSGLL